MINAYADVRPKKIDSLLRPWARVLEKEFSLNTGSGIFVELEKSPRDNSDAFHFFIDTSATARIASNPLIMAIVMHYGFETHCLDVSSNPVIALWFALHTAGRNRQRKIFFTPSRTEKPESYGNHPPAIGELPSVYIFLQMNHDSNPVIELTQVEQLKGVAERPFIQSAVALPFTIFGALGADSIERKPVIFRQPVERFPSAVVKIHFGVDELYSARPDLTADKLFPKHERLYQVLRKARVPRLAVYE